MPQTVDNPDDCLFEIGTLTDTDDDSLDNEYGTPSTAKTTESGNNTSKVFQSKMEDPTYETNSGHNPPGVKNPKYQAILSTGSDDERDKPRRMMGYAAYHGPKWIPAEIKDNIEHFFATTPMAPPSFFFPPPPMMAWGKSAGGHGPDYAAGNEKHMD